MNLMNNEVHIYNSLDNSSHKVQVLQLNVAFEAGQTLQPLEHDYYLKTDLTK